MILTALNSRTTLQVSKQKPEKKMVNDSGQSSMENSADISMHLEGPEQTHNQTQHCQSMSQSSAFAQQSHPTNFKSVCLSISFV